MDKRNPNDVNNANVLLKLVQKTSQFVESLCDQNDTFIGEKGYLELDTTLDTTPSIKHLLNTMANNEKFEQHYIDNVAYYGTEPFFDLKDNLYVFEELNNTGPKFVSNYSPVFDIMWLLATVDEKKAFDLILKLDTPRPDFKIMFESKYNTQRIPLLPQTILKLWRDFAAKANLHNCIDFNDNTNKYEKDEAKKYLAFLSLFVWSNGRGLRPLFDNDNNIFKQGIHDIGKDTFKSVTLSKIRKYFQTSENSVNELLRIISNMFGINMCIFSNYFFKNNEGDTFFKNPIITNEFAKTCFLIRYKEYKYTEKEHEKTNEALVDQAQTKIKNIIDRIVKKKVQLFYGSLELRLMFALKVNDNQSEFRQRQEEERLAQLEAQRRIQEEEQEAEEIRLRDIESQENQIQKNKNMLDTQTVEYNRLRQLQEESEAKIKTQQKGIENQERKLKETNEQTERLETEIKNLNEQSENTQKTLDKKQSELLALNDTFDKLSARTDAQQIEYNTLHEEIEKQTDNLKKTQTELEDKIKELETYKTTYAEIQTKKESDEEQIHKNKLLLAEQTENLEQQKTEMDRINNSIKTKSLELENQTKLYTNKQESYEKQLKDIAEASQKREEEKTKFINQQNLYDDELNKIQAKIKLAKEELDRANEEQQEQQDELKRVQAQLRKAQENYAQKMAETDQNKTNLEAQNQALSTKKKQHIANTKSQIQQTNKEFENLKSQLAEKTQQVEMFKPACELPRLSSPIIINAKIDKLVNSLQPNFSNLSIFSQCCCAMIHNP